MESLKAGLALYSARGSVEIQIKEVGDAPARGNSSSRLTHGAVREARVKELTKRAPFLERAITELDLQLAD